MRHSLDLKISQEIIFVGIKTHSPKESGRYRFRLRLLTQLNLPFLTVPVPHIEFRASAATVFVEKPHRGGRFMVFSSWSIKEISRSNRTWIGPKDGLKFLSRNFFESLFPPRVNRGRAGHYEQDCGQKPWR